MVELSETSCRKERNRALALPALSSCRAELGQPSAIARAIAIATAIAIDMGNGKGKGQGRRGGFEGLVYKPNKAK